MRELRLVLVLFLAALIGEIPSIGRIPLMEGVPLIGGLNLSFAQQRAVKLGTGAFLENNVNPAGTLVVDLGPSFSISAKLFFVDFLLGVGIGNGTIEIGSGEDETKIRTDTSSNAFKVGLRGGLRLIRANGTSFYAFTSPSYVNSSVNLKSGGEREGSSISIFNIPVGYGIGYETDKFAVEVDIPIFSFSTGSTERETETEGVVESQSFSVQGFSLLFGGWRLFFKIFF